MGVILREYQHEGVGFMYETLDVRKQPGVILADDQGLGKTLQTIAYISKAEDILYVLMALPKNVMGNWPSEIAKFIPDLDHTDRFTNASLIAGKSLRPGAVQIISSRCPPMGLDAASVRRNRESLSPRGYIYLCTYEGLKSESIKAITDSFEFDLVVGDEIQKTRNVSSGNSETFFNLKSKRVIFLSGTVGDKNVHWHPIIKFFYPGKYDNKTRFDAVFNRGEAYSAEDAELIREAVSPWWLRRKKETVAPDIPPAVYYTIPVEVTEEFRREMDLEDVGAELMEEASVAADAITEEILAAMAAKMDRTSEEWKALFARAEATISHATTVAGFYAKGGIAGGGIAKIRKKLGEYKVEQAIDTILKFIAGGERVIVFYHHRVVGDAMEKALTDLGLAISRIDGRMNIQEKDIAIKRFTDGRSTIIFVSTLAGNAGINLQTAWVNLLVEPDYSWSVTSQAVARSHRIGQVNVVRNYMLVVQKSYDSRMYAIQKLKKIFSEISSGDRI